MNKGRKLGDPLRRAVTLSAGPHDLLASTEGGGFAVTTTTGEHDLPGRPKLFPTAVVLDEQNPHKESLNSLQSAVCSLQPTLKGSARRPDQGDSSRVGAVRPYMVPAATRCVVNGLPVVGSVGTVGFPSQASRFSTTSITPYMRTQWPGKVQI